MSNWHKLPPAKEMVVGPDGFWVLPRELNWRNGAAPSLRVTVDFVEDPPQALVNGELADFPWRFIVHDGGNAALWKHFETKREAVRAAAEWMEGHPQGCEA